MYNDNWKMVGEYEDGTELEVYGYDEEDCMESLINKEHKHGKLVWYSGVNDNDYSNGEYIGEENFIY